MQTFFPSDDIHLSAAALDKKRCFKQVVECKQILCALRAPTLPEDWLTCKTYINQSGLNHPAVQMWKGYEEFLKHYYNIFLDYCINVHKINTTMQKLNTRFDAMSTMDIYIAAEQWPGDFPFWYGVDDFHRSHRARLIEKDRDFYLPKFPLDENFNSNKYLWPVMSTKTFRII